MRLRRLSGDVHHANIILLNREGIYLLWLGEHFFTRILVDRLASQQHASFAAVDERTIHIAKPSGRFYSHVENDYRAIVCRRLTLPPNSPASTTFQIVRTWAWHARVAGWLASNCDWSNIGGYYNIDACYGLLLRLGGTSTYLTFTIGFLHGVLPACNLQDHMGLLAQSRSSVLDLFPASYDLWIPLGSMR